MAAAGRTIDDLIIAALGGTAYIGKAGTTTQALTQTIVSSSAGMTKAKILQAMTYLNENVVDTNDRFLVCSSSQIADLLNTTEDTSIDYNNVRALVEGTLDTWLGFTIVRSERLATNASSERLCYAYARNAVQLAIQKEVTGRIDERNDKNYAWQVYVKLCAGATRLDENGVVQIACTETY
jgi:hypothetical protein